MNEEGDLSVNDPRRGWGKVPVSDRGILSKSGSQRLTDVLISFVDSSEDQPTVEAGTVALLQLGTPWYRILRRYPQPLDLDPGMSLLFSGSQTTGRPLSPGSCRRRYVPDPRTLGGGGVVHHRYRVSFPFSPCLFTSQCLRVLINVFI